MNKTTKITSAALLFLASSMALACEYPARPHLPDGASATKDDLLAAKNAVQSFIGAVDEYLVCIEEEDEAVAAETGKQTTDEKARRNKLMNQKFDAANDEKALVGEQFNQEIRAYNEKLKETKD
jgi:hypothetical protein